MAARQRPSESESQALSQTTPDPASPASGVGVSGKQAKTVKTVKRAKTAKRVAEALVPIAILGLLVASDLLLCPIKWVLGFPCPGCGLTRATFSVLHGDLQGALAHHPLVWLIAPLVLYTLGRITLVSAGVISPRAFDPLNRLPKWFWWASVALLLGVWVVRLAGGLGGPSDPVDPEGGLLYRVLSGSLWG